MLPENCAVLFLGALAAILFAVVIILYVSGGLH